MEKNLNWKYNFANKSLNSINLPTSNKDLNEIISGLPSGVFTTIRTKSKTRAFQISSHLLRLEESINLSGEEFHYSIDDLRPALLEILKLQIGNEHRIRFHMPLNELSTCYIFVEKFLPYSEYYYTNGVLVKTNQLMRLNPKAKLSNFLKLSLEEKKYLAEIGMEESLILDENQFILEGLSSNFFGIMENQIWTAEKNILNGITRKIVISEAQNIGMEIKFEPINLSELPKLDEAFITSTSRKIMPIKQIDSFMIGNGRPGPITKRLMNVFKKRFLQEFEKI
jgi:branched-subunit amino acid aminotransferase/4-amino-4-deoxychorismate lyase